MYLLIKRFLDITLSFLGLIILLPILIITAVAIKLESRGPVIFCQKRIGKNGKVFNIYKFRSMCVGAERIGSGVYSAKGDARVTRIGRMIRATSIDELPQLVNILKGEMSLVGPRPVLTYHPWPYEEYTEEQKKRFDVRPGVTGWAQVNGRKGVQWDKRIEYDCEYVDNLSFWMDIKILFKTVIKVISNADNVTVSATVDPAIQQDQVLEAEPQKESVI